MDSYHLSVVKIEGLEEAQGSYLYIYSGLNILRVLTLESFGIDPVPISKGVLRFLVEDCQTSTLQASLTFKSDIFTRYGFHWLPLFIKPNETLTEIPEEVHLPRVLIEVQSNALSSVEEITEESESYEEASEIYEVEDLRLLKAKNIGMSVRILELEELLDCQKISFDEEIEGLKTEFFRLSRLYEQGLEKEKKIFGVAEGLRSEMSKVKDELMKNEELVDQLRVSIGVLNKEVLGNKEREASILRTLEVKDLEMFRLKCSKEVVLRESFQGQVSIKAACKGMERVFNEEAVSKIVIRPCEGLKKTKTPSISTHTQSSVSPNLDKRSISPQNGREFVLKKFYDAEKAQASIRFKCLDELDAQVKKFLKSNKLENFATICNELTYNIGNKKVIVYSKPDGLYCKSGGTVKKFEYFIRNICYQDIENYKKKLHSESLHQRIKTSLEFDKIGVGVIHKTFDGVNRAKSGKNNRSTKKPTTPQLRSSLSPNAKCQTYH